MFYGKHDEHKEIFDVLWKQLENEINNFLYGYLKNRYNFVDMYMNFSFGITAFVFILMYLFFIRDFMLLGFSCFFFVSAVTRHFLRYKNRMFFQKNMNELNYKVARFGHAIFVKRSPVLCLVRPQNDLIQGFLPIPIIRDQSKGFGSIDFKKFEQVCGPYSRRSH